MTPQLSRARQRRLPAWALTFLCIGAAPALAQQGDTTNQAPAAADIGVDAARDDHSTAHRPKRLAAAKAPPCAAAAHSPVVLIDALRHAQSNRAQFEPMVVFDVAAGVRQQPALRGRGRRTGGAPLGASVIGVIGTTAGSPGPTTHGGRHRKIEYRAGGPLRNRRLSTAPRSGTAPD